MKTGEHHEVSDPLQGYLVVHVGGYKRVSNYTAHVYSDGSALVSVPDRLVQARIHPVGSTEWYEEGWAVGDNPRERFCKWGGASPVYRFHDYEEAVLYIQRLRQKRKRPLETYSLVYFSRGVGGREYHRPVSSLDDIEVFEAELARETSESHEAAAERRAAFNVEYPELDRLRTAFGGAKALRLSLLLKSLRVDGGVEARQEMTKASFYRGVRELRGMGLIK